MGSLSFVSSCPAYLVDLRNAPCAESQPIPWNLSKWRASGCTKLASCVSVAPSARESCRRQSIPRWTESTSTPTATRSSLRPVESTRLAVPLHRKRCGARRRKEEVVAHPPLQPPPLPPPLLPSPNPRLPSLRLMLLMLPRPPC